MGLVTDIIFVRALKSNAELLAMLPSGDIYNTSIALPDEDIYNAPIPYIIVSRGPVTNDTSTKDGYEGEYDNVNISVQIAAKNRRELGTISGMVRETIKDFFENLTDDDDDYSLVPLDYQFSAQNVNYDSMKPCYWEELNYQCDTNV